MLRGIMQLVVFVCVCARVCACVLTQRAGWQQREELKRHTHGLQGNVNDSGGELELP